jgi:VWFA-related protein
MTRSAVFVLGLALALALAAPPGVGSQERSPAAPVFQSGVSLVLLPVFVIDRDGRAVRGLQPADFEVREDGRPAEIVAFRYVDTTDSDEQDDLRRASAARRRFLLLFDKSFTDPGGLHRAQQAAGDFVRRRLAFSDLAAVGTFDIHNGVRLVANFTDDRALLAHAISTLGVPSLTRISDPLALAADLALTDIRPTPGGAAETTTTPQALVDDVLRVLVNRMRAAEAQSYRQNVGLLLGGLGTLAQALRAVDGRKQILYFSAGFDARLLVGQWGSEQKSSGESVVSGRLWEVDGETRYGDSRLRDTLSQVTRDLSAADAVVHAIDVTGLGTDLSLSQTASSQDSVRDTTNWESLGFLAAETGGRLFKDTNDLGPALAEMLEMTSRYYVLGIQPRAEKAPGAFHKIKVKVSRKGVQLSHRPGYFEREPVAGQTALRRQFDLAELVMSGGERNEIPFTSLCLPFPAPGERQTLGLVVQVPRDSLRWTKGEPVSVEVYAYAVAEDGTVLDHLAHSVRLDPGQADPGDRAQGLSLFGTLSVPPGRYTLRLMVREGESGHRAVRFLDVSVPPYDGRAAFALPPLVVDEPDRWLNLELGPGQAAEGAGQPFRTPGGLFVPRASFEVQPGAPARLALIVWDPTAPGDPAADVEIRSSLTAADGHSVPAGRLRIERVYRDGGGRRTFILSYAPEAVAAGDYTLRIGLGEGGSLAEAYTLLRFRLPS